MEDNNKNALYCSHCGALIGEDEDYEEVNGEIVCTECYERNTTTCDRCGETIWTEDSYGDEYTTLCRHCYENHYTRCSCCDALLHEDDAYHLDGYDYCSECYHDEVDKSRSIHDYGYKPEPLFYGDSNRYFGIELEIDGAGKDSDNADEILAIANKDNEYMYIKGDGSLDDGMELVTHPMSLGYHKNYQWEEIMKKAISLGYRSHQTSIITIKRTSNYTAERGIYTDTTKTKRSQRVLKISPYIMEILKDYKLEQDEEAFRLGDKWVETDRLFVKWNGEPMNNQTPYGWLKEFCEKNDMPFYGIHSFRHFAASSLISAGLDVTTVSGALGHCNSGTTLNVYSHMFQNAQAKVSEAMDKAFAFLPQKEDTESE